MTDRGRNDMERREYRRKRRQTNQAIAYFVLFILFDAIRGKYFPNGVVTKLESLDNTDKESSFSTKLAKVQIPFGFVNEEIKF